MPPHLIHHCVIASLISCLFLYSPLHGEREKETNVPQVKEGNFSVLQQPFPLFSIGQTIVGKHDLLGYVYGDFRKGHRHKETVVTPSLLYGIRDDLALFVNLPVAARLTEDCHHSSGLLDAWAQLEYAWYTRSTPYFTNEATILGSITIPSGSTRKNPPPGDGSPSFFLGATVSHLATDWYAFGSTGIELPTRYRHEKPGKALLYQMGAGRNIGTLPGWSFVFFVEFNGIYHQRDTRNGIVDDNSGGNTIYLAPVLFVGSDNFVFQIGIAAVVDEHLFGQQNKRKYHASINIGYTLH